MLIDLPDSCLDYLFEGFANSPVILFEPLGIFFDAYLFALVGVQTLELFEEFRGGNLTTPIHID